MNFYLIFSFCTQVFHYASKMQVYLRYVKKTKLKWHHQRLRFITNFDVSHTNFWPFHIEGIWRTWLHWPLNEWYSFNTIYVCTGGIGAGELSLGILISTIRRITPLWADFLIWQFTYPYNDGPVFAYMLLLLNSTQIQSLPKTEITLFTDAHKRYKRYRTHDGVIKWKHFPRYWPFVRGIQRSPVNSPHKGQWRGALMFL